MVASKFLAYLVVGIALVGLSAGADAEDAKPSGGGELAAASQNPIANMISLPFQNNTYFGVTKDDEVANVLNLQPVYPIGVGDWNIITRTIAPLIYVPDPTDGLHEHLPNHKGPGDTFGLGDVNFSAYFSPANPGKVIWGIGPSITVPSATDDTIGSEKWSAGPAAVALIMPKPWVIGTLVRNLWSFAGDSDREDVNSFLLQPFVNYNLADGWYLVSSPVITANWEENDSDNRWSVPLGGGFGKILKIGKQPVNLQLQGFHYVESPRLGPDWAARLQVQFLFPK